MSLKCLFGLIVCLNYNGSWIPDADVNKIKDLCREVATAPASSFLNRTGDNRSGDNSGAVLADKLSDLGLEFSWSRDGSVYAHQSSTLNKRAVSDACDELRTIARYKKNWSE